MRCGPLVGFILSRGKVYLDAWRYVGSLTPVDAEGGTAPAVKSLVHNWTNAEFVQFVDELADIVNR